jgi:hypothetical protein
MPSEVIASFAYDPETQTLFVRFVSGTDYAYFDVPRAVFDDFKAAFSKGRFFAYRIRDRFAYRRLVT